MISGMIMGDLKTGLMVGGTLQLMRLGIAAFGEASVPDYFTGAVLGTVFAVISGKGAEYGIGLAVPVSLLMLQLDVVARFCNVYLLHRVDRAIDDMKINRIPRLVLSGSFLWELSRAIPILLMLLVGDAAVSTITRMVDEWTKNCWWGVTSRWCRNLVALPSNKTIYSLFTIGFLFSRLFTSANAWYLNRQCDCCNYCI